MKMKRLLSAALAAALAYGSLPAFPAASAVSFSTFRDVSDPVTAEECEFLRLLGVVHGKEDGSYFDPNGVFSRAEFVKMAICALDRSDEEPAQRNRTIYQDVGSTFWARGYINLASVIKLGSDSATPLVMGVGDGKFHPARAITYGEAVAILCRILGYGISDAASGGTWYDGYLALGELSGLTSGLSLGGADTITRAQAAALFYRLYFAKPKDSKSTYLTSVGGSEVENAIVLSTSATADDGTTGCFQTTQNTYKTDRTFDPTLAGREGKLLLDKDSKLLSFQPKAGVSDRAVTISSAEATYLMAVGGEKITIEPDTKVYEEGKETTWQAVYLNLSTATPAVFHYGADGKLAYLFLSGSSDEENAVMVCRSVPRSGVNPFSGMAGGGSYTMFKNGLPATAADIRQYDTAVWNPAARVIQVSDLKLTGVYENASPTPVAPTSITVMGHRFSVLPAARNDLDAFRPGDRITLLLTVNNEVAGAVSEDVIRENAIGLASISETSATVKLLQGGLEVSGEVYSGAAERFNNRLVSVTGISSGKLSLSELSSGSAPGSLDARAGLLGDRKVAENAVVYDRVEDGELVEVSYTDLPATVDKSRISFVAYDYAGRVLYLVLDDVTGDAYQYGYFLFKKGEKVDRVWALDTLCVRQGGADGEDITSQAGNYMGPSILNNTPGGIAYDAKGNVVAAVTLQSLSGVSRSAFDSDEMTVTVAGITYRVSDQVQVYNKAAEVWFQSGKTGMEAARAYSDNLTLYYDRSPADGGKIRMIVIP